MKCKCGFIFMPHFRDNEPQAFESFALINDEGYLDFVDLEIEIRTCTNERIKSKKIAQAAVNVGSVTICPDCSRLKISWPGAKSTGFYNLEPATTPEAGEVK